MSATPLRKLVAKLRDENPDASQAELAVLLEAALIGRHKRTLPQLAAWYIEQAGAEPTPTNKRRIVRTLRRESKKPRH